MASTEKVRDGGGMGEGQGRRVQHVETRGTDPRRYGEEREDNAPTSTTSRSSNSSSGVVVVVVVVV